MTANLSIAQGHDIEYYTRAAGGGHVGGVAYYAAAVGDNPPGLWAGKGAGRLGLRGIVDTDVIRNLFHEDIGPGGERLGNTRPRQYQDPAQYAEAEVRRYREQHPFASSREIDRVRFNAKADAPHNRPFFDVTIAAAKSVSLVFASLITDAQEHRDAGDMHGAAQLEAEARDIEDALVQTALSVVREIEEVAAYTRTGHHSATSGEWRDAAGVTGAIYVQYLSHEGDPHLHSHIVIQNRVQRADGADTKWRTLDGTQLYAQKPYLDVIADRELEQRLSRLGWPMKMRPDGNGAEIEGVSREMIEEYSTRSQVITPEIRQLVDEWKALNPGLEPTARTIKSMKDFVWKRTRAEADRDAEALRKKGVTPAVDLPLADLIKAWNARAVQIQHGGMPAVHGRARSGATGRARPVLDYAAKARVARIAVAQATEWRATWSLPQLIHQVGRTLPEMPDDAESKMLVAEVAALAVSGRAGTGAVMITAPDIADVSDLGVRASDGVSIYRPPHEARWTTLEHLDTEARILDTALRSARPLVPVAEAKAVAAQTDLSAAQQDALVRMLTAPTSTTALVAPAGAGKSHTMAEFARVWHQFTGGRVIGLTTSTNAARVLQGEGLAESYNIAEFLGKIEGSEELRHPVQVGDRDVLVIDEASQVSTADLALIQEAARSAGARTAMTGDTQQLGSVDAGGMFRLLVQELQRRGAAAELHEVRRFDAQWEREASVRLRQGDATAVAEYDRHGRIRAGDQQAIRERAVGSWLADVLEGKRSLLLAGTNAEAADLSARAQSKLIQLGAVGKPQAQLADGNRAGIGDLIRARLNTEIDAGGQRLTNRDTLKVTAWKGRHAEVRRQLADGSWSPAFIVPQRYLENSSELDYAGNTHVGQGRSVDTGHLLVSPLLTRQQFYVGMTRGMQENTAHVDTGPAAAQGKDYQQATAETVIKAILARDDADLSATEQMRLSQEHVTSAGHLLTLYGAVTRAEAYPEIDQAIASRLEPGDAARYAREHARPVLQGLLRRAEIEGRDVRGIIDRITEGPMDGARSVSGVLHGRARAEMRAEPEGRRSWAERTPEAAHPLAHELAAAMDTRIAELGRRQADQPESWATARLGELPEDEAERDTWTRAAGTAAFHREAQGVTDPEQDIAAGRHPDPAFEVARRDAVRELKVPDEQAEVRAASRGELEAHVLDGYRALAAAPADVSPAMRLTAQAEADARADAAEAEVRHDEAQALGFRALGDQLAAKTAELEEAQATRDAYDNTTATVRSKADLAAAELKHRGYDPVLGWEPESSDPEPDREQDPDAYVDWALRQARIADVDLAQAAREKLAQREAAADAEAELVEELELLDAEEEADLVPAEADKYTLSIMGQHVQHGAELRGGGGGEPPERSGGHRVAAPEADGSPFWRTGFRDRPEAAALPNGGERNGRPGAGRDEPESAAGQARRSGVDDLLARMDAELAEAGRHSHARPEPDATREAETAAPEASEPVAEPAPRPATEAHEPETEPEAERDAPEPEPGAVREPEAPAPEVSEPQPEPAHRPAAEVDDAEPEPEPAAPQPEPQAYSSGPEIEAEPDDEPESRREFDEHLASIDAALARSREALDRIHAEEAQRQASAEYVARIEREARLHGPEAEADGPPADRQADIDEEPEIG